MFTLPRYIKFKICSFLSKIDLHQFSQTSKYWYNLLQQDDFWNYKTLAEYLVSASDKPDYCSGRRWYELVSNSGDVVLIRCSSSSLDQEKLPLSNVVKHKQCNGRHYYVDIFGQLWYSEDKYVHPDYNYYGANVVFEDRDDPVRLKIETGVKSRVEVPPTREPYHGSGHPILKINLISRVKDIHPTNVCVFILTDTGILYIADQTLTCLSLQEHDVESLAGTDSFCCFITKYDQLYYLEKFGSDLKSIFVRHNVKHASVKEDTDPYFSWSNEIFFTDFHNVKWVWNNGLVKLHGNDVEPNDGFFCVDDTLIHKTSAGTEIIDTDVLCYGYSWYIKRRPKCPLYD